MERKEANENKLNVSKNARKKLLLSIQAIHVTQVAEVRKDMPNAMPHDS